MKTLKFLAVIAALMVASSICYAEGGKEAGNAISNGIVSLIKAPFTLLHKAGDSLGDSSTVKSSEDVAVSPVYDLDAETTG